MNSAEKLQHIEHLLKSHQTKEARPFIDELIHEEPSNVEVWYWRGVCERFDGELDLAENDFLSVIRNKPNHSNAFYGLGDVLEHKEELEEAIVAYQQAASLGNKQAAKKLIQYGSLSVSQEQNVTHRPADQQPSLNSDKGIDYTRLRDLLAAKEWRAADQETAKVMRKAINKDKWWGPLIEPEDIENFPCEDLRTIDQLWVYYSKPNFGCSNKAYFGYSVQKEIYAGLGGAKGVSLEILEKFGERVGWKKKGPYGGWYWLSSTSKLNFILRHVTPRGHLPSTFGNIPASVESDNMGLLLSLFSRLEICG